MNFHGYEIDLDKVELLAENNDYWYSCKKFLYDIKHENNTTSKQEAWLEKIANTHEEQYEKLRK